MTFSEGAKPKEIKDARVPFGNLFILTLRIDCSTYRTYRFLVIDDVTVSVPPHPVVADLLRRGGGVGGILLVLVVAGGVLAADEDIEGALVHLLLQFRAERPAHIRSRREVTGNRV